MPSRPYAVTTVTLTADVPFVVRGATRFVALVSASVDVNAVSASIGDSDSFYPLLLGLIPSEFPPGVDRITVTSTVGQVVKVATGSAMVYDTRNAPGGTSTMSITDLGGNGLGGETKANSLSITIATDQGAIPISGAVTTSGTVVASGAVADGAAIGGAGNPLLMAGQDGTLVQSLKTNATGQLEMVGAVADGAAVGATAPLMLGASDGTNVKRVSAVADNATTPTSGNLTSLPATYVSTARALTTAKVAFLSVDRGGKVLTTPCGTLDPVLAGYTVTVLDAAATTNAASIKAAAGMVYEVSAVNNAAYDVFIKLHNKASAPTVGTDIPYRVVRVPAGQTVTVTYPGGAYFATGIAYCVTKLVGKLDTTVLVAGDVQLSIQTA